MAGGMEGRVHDDEIVDPLQGLVRHVVPEDLDPGPVLARQIVARGGAGGEIGFVEMQGERAVRPRGHLARQKTPARAEIGDMARYAWGQMLDQEAGTGIDPPMREHARRGVEAAFDMRVGLYGRRQGS